MNYTKEECKIFRNDFCMMYNRATYKREFPKKEITRTWYFFDHMAFKCGLEVFHSTYYKSISRLINKNLNYNDFVEKVISGVKRNYGKEYKNNKKYNIWLKEVEQYLKFEEE